MNFQIYKAYQQNSLVSYRYITSGLPYPGSLGTDILPVEILVAAFVKEVVALQKFFRITVSHVGYC